MGQGQNQGKKPLAEMINEAREELNIEDQIDEAIDSAKDDIAEAVYEHEANMAVEDKAHALRHQDLEDGHNVIATRKASCDALRDDIADIDRQLSQLMNKRRGLARQITIIEDTIAATNLWLMAHGG